MFGFCNICQNERPCPPDAKCRELDGLSGAEYSSAYYRLRRGEGRQPREKSLAIREAEAVARLESESRLHELRETERRERAAAWQKELECRAEIRALRQEDRGARLADELARTAARAEELRLRIEARKQRMAELELRRAAAREKWGRRKAERESAEVKTTPERLAYVQRWHEAHRERVREIKRKSSANNRDTRQLYIAAHPEVNKAKDARRRAAMLSCPEGELAEIGEFYRFVSTEPRLRCYWCKKVVRIADRHVDHIIALAAGGSHSPANLCCSCSKCNEAKGSKDPAEFSGQAEIRF